MARTSRSAPTVRSRGCGCGSATTALGSIRHTERARPPLPAGRPTRHPAPRRPGCRPASRSGPGSPIPRGRPAAFYPRCPAPSSPAMNAETRDELRDPPEQLLLAPERDQLGVRQQLREEPAELGRVDLVALDRDDDRRRRDVAQQLAVGIGQSSTTPWIARAALRDRRAATHAVELQAPRRLDVLGHAGRIVQDGLERLLRRLALQVLGEQVVAVRQPERQVQPRRQQPDHPLEPIGFAAHEVPDRARAERRPDGHRRAERVATASRSRAKSANRKAVGPPASSNGRALGSRTSPWSRAAA